MPSGLAKADFPGFSASEVAEARTVVTQRMDQQLRQHAKALSKTPRLADVVPLVDAALRGRAWRNYSSHLVAPEWAPALRVPPTALDTVPPPDRVLLLPSGGARAPVLPSLFMPGFPKAATTFLYECLLGNFGPSHVGCGGRAEKWTAAACNRRFALTTLFSDARGRAQEWKETFFFGGKIADKADATGREDLLGLHGPDPRRGALASLPALWAWDRRNGPGRAQLQRIRTLCEDSPSLPLACAARNRSNQSAPSGVSCSAPRCSHLGVAACEGDNFKYSRAACRNTGALQAQPVGPCTHPACVRTAARRAETSGQFVQCKWGAHLQALNGGRDDSYCLHSLAPWAEAGELNLSVVDFTPNYLCDANAMRRIHATAPDGGAELRFIVVMRDPVYRAFSEWSMFSLGWNWDPAARTGRDGRHRRGAARRSRRCRWQRLAPGGAPHSRQEPPRHRACAPRLWLGLGALEVG